MRKPAPPSPMRGRPSLLSLPYPDPRYDMSLTPGFETEALMVERDAIRARKLRARARVDAVQSQALLALADSIDPAVTRYPETVASHRYMRAQRLRILGAVWKLCHEG